MPVALSARRSSDLGSPRGRRLRLGLALLAAAIATLTARADDQANGRGPGWRDLLSKLMTPAPAAVLPLPSEPDLPVDTSTRFDENRIVATETGAIDIHVRDAEIDAILEAIS